MAAATVSSHLGLSSDNVLTMGTVVIEVLFEHVAEAVWKLQRRKKNVYENTLFSDSRRAQLIPSRILVNDHSQPPRNDDHVPYYRYDIAANFDSASIGGPAGFALGIQSHGRGI